MGDDIRRFTLDSVPSFAVVRTMLEKLFDQAIHGSFDVKYLDPEGDQITGTFALLYALVRLQTEKRNSASDPHQQAFHSLSWPSGLFCPYECVSNHVFISLFICNLMLQ